MHADLRIGGLAPGERKQVRSRIYLVAAPAGAEVVLDATSADAPLPAIPARPVDPAAGPGDIVVSGDAAIDAGGSGGGGVITGTSYVEVGFGAASIQIGPLIIKTAAIAAP